MKLTKILTFLSLFISLFSYSQSKTSKITVQLGIAGSVEGAKIKTPAFYGNYEYFLSDNITIGGIVGYKTLSFEQHDYELGEIVEEKYGSFIIGGASNYYFVNNENINIYAGLKLGYASNHTGNMFFAYGAGANYNISEKMALNAELGMGLSLLKIGVAFKI